MFVLKTKRKIPLYGFYSLYFFINSIENHVTLILSCYLCLNFQVYAVAALIVPR